MGSAKYFENMDLPQAMTDLNPFKEDEEAPHFQQPSSSSTFSKAPTTEKNLYWLYARNQSTQNNNYPVNSGKWLIFEPSDQIDATWSLIEKETKDGELGIAAKVSTMKDKSEDEKNLIGGNENFVICVYTYDHTNEEDVMRVRERLRELGFKRKLPYKTDDATLAGVYRSTTGRRVSKWYC